jgi:hypothetical protein
METILYCRAVYVEIVIKKKIVGNLFVKRGYIFLSAIISSVSHTSLSMQKNMKYDNNFCKCSSEVLCVSVLVKSCLENRDYDLRGPVTLTMQHPSIGKSWH